MDRNRLVLPELRNLALHLSLTRQARGLSQGDLGRASKLSQAQVSLFESGRRIPSLEQFVRLARALDVPIQRLFSGEDRPGVELNDLAVELRALGAVDLWVANAAVPGAARRVEEVIALAASGSRPDPRVIEALPLLLSWNSIDPMILEAQGHATKTTYRLAWLADIAMAIVRQDGFPGAPRRDQLEEFINRIPLPTKGSPWDFLGGADDVPPRSPLWKRWRIGYGANLEDFKNRAAALVVLRESEKQREHLSRMSVEVREMVKRLQDDPKPVKPTAKKPKAARTIKRTPGRE